MLDVHKLPVEILGLIFQQLRRLSSHDAPSTPVQAHFPFNIAYSCSRWSTILESCPPCCKVVTVDLADDPTSMLEIFEMYTKNCREDSVMAISVHSRIKQAAMASAALENIRARAVFTHLEASGALFHCSIILFDLVFQSSLPCAARILTDNLPFLSELRLSCAVYDLECQSNYDDALESSLDITEEQKFRFPSLEKVSLPGWSFMQLRLLGQEWLRKLECSTRDDVQVHLTVTHFAFWAPFWIHGEDRYVSDFLEALEHLRVFKRVTLSDLSLRYQPSKRYSRRYNLKIRQLTLDSVSPHFMYAFFRTTYSNDRSLRALTLRNCNIPDLGSRVGRHYNPGNLILQLVDIRPPDGNPQSFNEDSIYNAIGAFPAAHVFLLRCSNVTSRFFYWLCQDMENGLELADLCSLTIHDCNEFEFEDLRFLIEAYEPHDPLDKVEISGKVPILSTFEAQWLSEFRKSVRITWNAETHEKFDEECFITQLWPSEDHKVWDEDEANLIYTADQ